jgi:hypothetical protein
MYIDKVQIFDTEYFQKLRLLRRQREYLIEMLLVDHDDVRKQTAVLNVG